MKISTKGRYGLRAMIDLALNGAGGVPVLLSDIARRQGISEKYLEHIFSVLHKGGMVKSQRGRKGGYLLARAAHLITLSELITVLEGPCDLVDCVSNVSACPRTPVCAARDIWEIMGARIREVLGGYTLASLVDMQQLKDYQESAMYYI